MFSMPGAGGVPWQAMEGYSDDNPICLYGESVERFRALLSVFYALYVLRCASVQNSPHADIASF